MQVERWHQYQHVLCARGVELSPSVNEDVEVILPFLSIFYEATLCISGISYVTSNIYMLEVVGIWHGVMDLLNSNIKDSATHKMAKNMKEKYKKY